MININIHLIIYFSKSWADHKLFSFDTFFIEEYKTNLVQLFAI